MSLLKQSRQLLPASSQLLPLTGVGAKRQYRTGVRSFKKIPGPTRIPLWGNLWQYKLGHLDLTQYHKVLETLYKQYGPLVREKHGPLDVIHVFSPEDVHTLYGEEGKMPMIVPFQETAQEFRKKYDFSLGLGNSNGDEWYRLRNAVRQLMLTPRQVQSYLPYTEKVCDDFIKTIYEKRNKIGQVPKLRDEIGKWIIESAGTVCFEKRLGYFTKEKQELVDEIMTANKGIFYLSGLLKFSLPIYKLIPTPKFKRLLEMEYLAHSTSHKLTRDAFEDIKKLVALNQLGDRYSFLTTLLSRKEINDKDITSITHNLMIDGLSMTVPTMLHNLYCLAVNERVQQKAYEEVSSIIKKGEPVTIKHLNKLHYLKSVVKETFRFYPTNTEVSRILQQDQVLSGYLVPKNTYVSINMHVHFQNEKFFNNPTEYKPERWVRGDEAKEEVSHRVLTPFGLGARACIGRRFAEQDLHTGLVKILLNFKLKHPEEGRPLEQLTNTSLFPRTPVQVQFIPRN